jgi:anti-sigma factor RsiW
MLHTLAAELSAREQAGLADHLAGCTECREYAALLRKLQPALTRAMHTRWDSRRPSSKSSLAIEQRWKEKKMKRQFVRLFTVAAGIGVVVLLFLFGPGCWRLSDRLNTSTGTVLVTLSLYLHPQQPQLLNPCQ